MSEHLTDEEQIARLRSWWQDNGTSLLVTVVLVVAAVVGWRWYQSYQEARLHNASDLYAEFLQAEGEAGDRLAERIIEEGGGTAYPSFVLFAQAEAAVSGGDAAAAEPLLRRAVEVASDQVLADLARLRLARVLFASERSDDALRVLEEIRGEGYLALAGELKGDVHLSRDERELAHRAYLNAMNHVQSGDQRPLLEMKIADTADASDS